MPQYGAQNCFLLRELFNHVGDGRSFWQRQALVLVFVCLAAFLNSITVILHFVGQNWMARCLQFHLAKQVVRAQRRAAQDRAFRLGSTVGHTGTGGTPEFLCACKGCRKLSSVLNPQQRQALEASRVVRVRKLLGQQGLHAEAANSSQWCSDLTIMRYLESYGSCPALAAKYLAATIKWRIQNSVHELTVTEFTEELRKGVVSFGGFDSQSRPVFIVRFVPGFSLRLLIFMLEVGESIIRNSMEPDVLRKDAPSASATPGVWQRIYRSMFRGMKRVESDRKVQNRDRWVWIVEWGSVQRECTREACTQCTPSEDSPVPTKYAGGVSASELIGAFRICNEHYPNRLHAAYVLGAPEPIVSLFRILAKKSTKRKVRFVRLRDGCDRGSLSEYGPIWRRPWAATDFIQLINYIDGSLAVQKSK